MIYTLSDLPDEIIGEIINKLDPSSRKCLSRVNGSFFNITEKYCVESKIVSPRLAVTENDIIFDFLMDKKYKCLFNFNDIKTIKNMTALFKNGEIYNIFEQLGILYKTPHPVKFAKTFEIVNDVMYYINKENTLMMYETVYDNYTTLQKNISRLTYIGGNIIGYNNKNIYIYSLDNKYLCYENKYNVIEILSVFPMLVGFKKDGKLIKYELSSSDAPVKTDIIFRCLNLKVELGEKSDELIISKTNRNAKINFIKKNNIILKYEKVMFDEHTINIKIDKWKYIIITNNKISRAFTKYF